MAERLHQLQRFFLVLAGFACPLLFYTDLTRNPYYTQIAGLNILMWLCLGCWVWSSFLLKKWEIPKTVLDIPWLGWLGVCLVSGLVSYWGHAVFFRPAIFNEGFRIGLFTVSNAVLVFYWGAWIGMSKEENTSSVRGWFLFLMVWSFLWFLFPHLRKIPATPGTWDRVWDPYGGILWLGGIVMVWRLTRKGSPWDFWNLLMATGFLAAGYGILQYFGVEMVWPKRLDPYGVRAVSTFGNPNFLSSYLVVLLPMAAVFFLQARSLEEKIFYGLYFLTYEASIVSSLTRSSWLGALAALGCLGFSPACRRAFRENRKEVAVLGTLALILIFMWPTGGSSSMTVLGRVKELKEILPQARLEGPGPYSPWYQRLLIWVCCWQMGLENPLLGKGWGVLELFYPFYQGPNLLALDIFRTLRTHANNAHNEIVEIWATTGILGVGLFFWFWGVFFRYVWSHREHGVVGGVAAGVLGMLVDNLLNVSLHFAVPAYLFWWQVGVVCGMKELGNKNREIPCPGKVFPLVFATGMLLVCIGAGWLWMRQWQREVHYFKGFKYMHANVLDPAVKELKLSYDWHSREVNMVYELGNAYARTGNYEKAVQAYQDALKANCGYDEIFYNLATVLGQKLGRWEQARSYYQMALWIQPLSAPYYAAMAALYFREPSRYAPEAVALMRQAIRLFPNDVNAFNHLGYFYTVMGEFLKAETAYTQALKLDPASEAIKKNLTSLRARQKK